MHHSRKNVSDQLTGVAALVQPSYQIPHLKCSQTLRLFYMKRRNGLLGEDIQQQSTKENKFLSGCAYSGPRIRVSVRKRKTV